MYKYERNNNANVYDDAHAFNSASASAIYAIDNYSFYVLDNFKNILWYMFLFF